jgi:hypothetical protein
MSSHGFSCPWKDLILLVLDRVGAEYLPLCIGLDHSTSSVKLNAQIKSCAGRHTYMRIYIKTGIFPGHTRAAKYSCNNNRLTMMIERANKYKRREYSAICYSLANWKRLKVVRVLKVGVLLYCRFFTSCKLLPHVHLDSISSWKPRN